MHPLLHDSPNPANFSSSSILFPKVVLIRGIWWSRSIFHWFNIQYNPANNISEDSQLRTNVIRSNAIQYPGETNITVDYFPQPILTNSISLHWFSGPIFYVSNLSKIPGYYGNYWVVFGNYSSPLEIELYGCEDYDLEKGDNPFTSNALFIRRSFKLAPLKINVLCKTWICKLSAFTLI